MERALRQKLEREHIAKEEPATWVDSPGIMQNGRLILTDKHLVFALNDAPKAALSISVDTINSTEHTSVLTDHNILSVTYMQYDNARFSVLDYDSWEKAIETRRLMQHVF